MIRVELMKDGMAVPTTFETKVEATTTAKVPPPPHTRALSLSLSLSTECRRFFRDANSPNIQHPGHRPSGRCSIVGAAREGGVHVESLLHLYILPASKARCL